MQEFIDTASDVATALKGGRAVVALESTIVTHGMDFPANLEIARDCEAAVRATGAIPATIAIIEGRLKVGLAATELEALAMGGQNASKASRRDIAALVATGGTAGTTVAVTMQIAAAAQETPKVKIPEAGVPQIMTLEGRYVRVAYNNEGYAILGYKLANLSVGEEWMMLEVGLALREGVPDYTLKREAVSLELPDGHPDAWLTTFTIITTAADPGMDRIHDRQPLVLEPEQWEQWLDPTENDPDVVRELLEFAQPGRFEAHPIGRAVGATSNNGPGLLEPAPREELIGVVDPMTGEVIGG